MALHLTLKELAIFTAIAQENHIVKACNTLGLTQSAASQALAKLELRLQKKLFDRHGKRLILNEAGRIFLPEAINLLSRAEALESLFLNQHIALKMGASTTIGNYLMPHYLSRLRQHHPQSSLEMRVGNTQEIVHLVANFEVDIGFIEGFSHHSELTIYPWQADLMQVFVAKNHPCLNHHLTLTDLATIPWLLREKGSGTREVVERYLTQQLGNFKLDMELGNSEAIKHAVMAGLGISCLSSYAIADLIASDKITLLNSPLPTFSRTLYCIVHKNKTVTAGMKALLSLMQLSHIAPLQGD